MSQSILSYESVDELSGSNLDLNLSAMGFYPYPFLPLLGSYCSFLPSLSDENSDHKRLKRSYNVSESIGSNFSLYTYEENTENNPKMSRKSSTSSINSLPRQKFRDHIRTYKQRYLEAEGVETSNSEEREEEERESGDGMKLVQLLISCAEAVACRDKSHASILLSELRSRALVFGSSFQRVASCFVQGLEDRLTSVQPLGAVGYVTPKSDLLNTDNEKKHEASRLVYDICPHVKFAHFVANSAILEAFEGESYVHLVDLGQTAPGLLPGGQQWRDLIRGLATRSGGPPRQIKITAVGVCAERLRPVGDELTAYARGLGLDFEFLGLESDLESFKIEEVKRRENEVLVVNSMLQLHCVVKESRGALNSVLKKINTLKPKILVLVEQDSSHNGPFFLGRFMEALHYYSAIFDSLDTMMPKYDTRRAKIEQFYFASEIKNIISCEGPARVERHERVDQWRRRMSRAGFQCGPIKMLAQAQQWLKKMEICDGYTVVEEKGCLVMGWKNKPILAVSCWKC